MPRSLPNEKDRLDMLSTQAEEKKKFGSLGKLTEAATTTVQQKSKPVKTTTSMQLNVAFVEKVYGF